MRKRETGNLVEVLQDPKIEEQLRFAVIRDFFPFQISSLVESEEGFASAP